MLSVLYTVSEVHVHTHQENYSDGNIYLSSCPVALLVFQSVTN